MLGFRSAVLLTVGALAALPLFLHPDAQPVRAWMLKHLIEEAPAWAQAVGTVGAVVAAVWISSQELRRRRNSAVRSFDFVRALLQRDIALCHTGTVSRSGGIVDEAYAGLREVHSLSCAIDLGELDHQRAIDLVRIRSELSQLFVYIEAARNAEGVINTPFCWNNLDARLGRVIETLDLPTSRSGL